MKMMIREAGFPDDRKVVAELFREYAEGLDFDLGFQAFEDEIRNLPDAYVAPGGVVLLGETEGAAVGCVALRPLERGVCEMKRLFVRPNRRGGGAGRSLGSAIIAAARKGGYEWMRLDTVKEMTAANALYRSLGFRECAAYCHNPLPHPCFYELRL